MKAYVKPDLVYENFELSDSIAVCMWDMNLADKYVCGAVADGKGNSFGLQPTTLFLESTGVCDIDTAKAEVYCYEVASSSDVKLVFNS